MNTILKKEIITLEINSHHIAFYLNKRQIIRSMNLYKLMNILVFIRNNKIINFSK